MPAEPRSGADGPRRFVLACSAFGLLVFGGALLLSYLSPIQVEKALREVVRIELEKRVGEKVEALSHGMLATLAKRTLERQTKDIAALKAGLAAHVPERVAQVVGDMLNADCACRQQLAKAAVDIQVARIGTLEQAQASLTRLIEVGYATVIHRLMNDFRVFTASNAGAFLLLGLIAVFRPGATLQLLLPAAALTGAVLIAGILYLRQDWLHTLLFGDYLGFAYTGYLCLVALLLADILMNRARITTRLVNGLLQVVGSAVHAFPC